MATMLAVAQQPMPKFNAPPGQQVNVVKTVQHYNFYPLTRTILIPWNRLLMNPGQVPSGNKILSTFVCPSAKISAIHRGPQGKLKSFGAPSKHAYQSFSGKDGDGAIVYMEYTNKLPANAKEVLSKVIFGTNTPPEPKSGGPGDQFLVNDHTVIIWSFKNEESQVRQEHQKMIFALISEMANAQKAATQPKK
jgi:hypothetical protein